MAAYLSGKSGAKAAKKQLPSAPTVKQRTKAPAQKLRGSQPKVKDMGKSLGSGLEKQGLSKGRVAAKGKVARGECYKK